ncbi:hypothetical protein KM043_004097 [Ampulex compressa]|nr:hypothetical protein KM043_004097 [Ampulex compressa]
MHTVSASSDELNLASVRGCEKYPDIRVSTASLQNRVANSIVRVLFPSRIEHNASLLVGKLTRARRECFTGLGEFSSTPTVDEKAKDLGGWLDTSEETPPKASIRSQVSSVSPGIRGSFPESNKVPFSSSH